MLPVINDMPGSFMFNVFPILFSVVFVLIFGAVLLSIVKGIRTWNYNNAQPVLSVTARVVAKRTDVSGGSFHHDSDAIEHHHGHVSTDYYVTFEVESEDRMEFHVRGDEYGRLIEGDVGKLTFQGTRYLGFERKGG